MTNVLLVYPRFPETFWGYQRALKLIGIAATHPPLGLLTVAGTLPEDRYRFHLVDLNVTELEKQDLDWADVVLTGGMMIQRPSTEWIIRQANDAHLPVVVGGPDVTSCHEAIQGSAHLVLGEADQQAFALKFDELCRTCDPMVVDLRGTPPDLNAAALPRYDIVSTHDYASVAIQVSRGCPFKCEFCDIPELFGRTTRYKSADRTIQELEMLYTSGWRGSVFWVDDNFIGNKTLAKRLLPDIVEWQRAHGMPFSLYTQASVNMASDDELLELMVESGFDSVFLGIETPLEDSLRETRKIQNVKHDLMSSIRHIQEAGMEVMAGFIIGFDNDPPDVDQHIIRFIQKSGIPVAMTGLLTPLPASPLFDRLKEEGRLLPESVSRQGDNTFQFDFRFQTVQRPESLIQAYENVLRAVYGTPKNYFERVETLYSNLGTKSFNNAPVEVRKLLGFLRSLLLIPTSRYGWSYARFLIRVVFRYPFRFPDAVRQGIVGLHLYQVTQERLAQAK